MKTILVADPRFAVQNYLEWALQEQGYGVDGPPDLVVTSDSPTARFWSRLGVPVVTYLVGDEFDLPGLLTSVGTLLPNP